MPYRLRVVAGTAVCLTAFLILGATRLRKQTESPDDSGENSATFPRLFLRDVVVSNTDQKLKETDQFFNSEPGVAINPTDARKIVVSSFSGAWSQTGFHAPFKNAPIWYSTNGGALWTKEFTIPAPPGVPASPVTQSPCDETFAYSRNGILFGTFLLNGSGEEGGNCSSFGESEASGGFAAVYTGGTTDPADARVWQWNVVHGKTQPTNQVPPDQPWVVVNKDPVDGRSERVYVGYQGNSSMQVAVAQAKLPADFSIDHQSGTRVSFSGNPGHRLAANHRSGTVYSLYQQGAAIDCSNGLAVSYMLNRSLDGGATWEIDGNMAGIPVAQVCSHQNLVTNLFGEPEPNVLAGGVNSLRGGIDAIAVDSNSGAVYVVYGEYDKAVNRDRIKIVRIKDSFHGGVEIEPSYFVSGPEHQSALPGVAVTADGSVGVLYDTADGLDESTGRPYFSVHFALSRNAGKTFQDVIAQRFLFPENAPSGALSPRPLGDYQQLKSFGDTFYGVFAGDGESFGRPFHKIDPIFVKTSSRQ